MTRPGIEPRSPGPLANTLVGGNSDEYIPYGLQSTLDTQEVKIGYSPEKGEQYISAPLRCFKFQRYGYYTERCRGCQCAAEDISCSQKDPDDT